MLQRNQCISIYWSRNMLWIYDSLNSERLKSNGSISHCYHSVYSRKLHVVGLMKTQLTAKWKKYETTEINEESGWEVKRVELLLVNMVLSASLLTDWAHNPHYHEGSESICCTLWPLCWEAWHHFYQFQRIRGAYICLLCQAFSSGPTFLMLSITVLLGFDSPKTHLWSKNCQTYLSKFVCGMWIVKWSSSVHILPSQHTPVCSFCPWRTPHSVKQKKLGSTVFITWFSPGGMYSRGQGTRPVGKHLSLTVLSSQCDMEPKHRFKFLSFSWYFSREPYRLLVCVYVPPAKDSWVELLSLQEIVSTVFSMLTFT